MTYLLAFSGPGQQCPLDSYEIACLWASPLPLCSSLSLLDFSGNMFLTYYHVSANVDSGHTELWILSSYKAGRSWHWRWAMPAPGTPLSCFSLGFCTRPCLVPQRTRSWNLGAALVSSVNVLPSPLCLLSLSCKWRASGRPWVKRPYKTMSPNQLMWDHWSWPQT